MPKRRSLPGFWTTGNAGAAAAAPVGTVRELTGCPVLLTFGCFCLASRQAARKITRLYDSYMQNAGMRVTHPTWNEGIVLDSRMQGNDEIVDVVFESVGIKRLAASLAKLTIVK